MFFVSLNCMTPSYNIPTNIFWAKYLFNVQHVVQNDPIIWFDLIGSLPRKSLNLIQNSGAHFDLFHQFLGIESLDFLIYDIIIQTAAALSELNQRKVGCLVGAAIADAAARPLHWVYDLSDLNKAVASSPDTPEFWPVSVSPFYDLPTGENSCYFDQVKLAWRSHFLSVC